MPRLPNAPATGSEDERPAGTLLVVDQRRAGVPGEVVAAFPPEKLEEARSLAKARDFELLRRREGGSYYPV